ncbi:MAG TPA: hypothetical protein VKB26_06235 [Candidatus Acidoferrales bacterium]|nr:hypothetical protein [Candidatus Acidoferrales bacterium]
MIRQAKLAYLVVGLLAIPFVATAQTRVVPVRPVRAPVQMAHPGAIVASPARTLPTQPRIIRLPADPSVQRDGSSSSQMSSTPNIAVFPNGTNPIVFPDATSFDLNQLLNSGAPGFGFDFTHQAALQGNLGEKAFIDPVTQQDIASAERLARITPGFDGGFIPFWGGYSEPAVEEEPQQQQQPQVIVLQQPVPSSGSAQRYSAPEPAPAEQQAPLPDVGEFTLVLHNGDKIKAVAFTRQKDQIVYVTKDGKRDSFAAGDLDVSATEQLNQNHGTPLHLSL